MKKLTLNVEQLEVESFAAGEAGDARAGTVQGLMATRRPTCAQTCTCDVTCTNTQPIVSCYDPCG